MAGDRGHDGAKLASRLLPPLVERVLRETGCTLTDVDIVPHQASGPAIEFMARRLGIPAERLHATIAQHGNMVAASIPFVLHGVRQKRPAGTRILLLGTAAGYTQAACLFTL
jgi:3-oxoacyl-[acyl-carrier-protein] synthase-3